MPKQTFAELQVGDTFPPMESTVTVEGVERHSGFRDDDHPWYRGPSPWGGPIAPLTVNNADFDRFLRANDFPMNGIIPTKTSREFYGPVMVGSTITTTCTVVEAFERKGRHYITFEYIATDESGKVLIKKRDTLLQMPQAAKPE
jgi:hypothetical protein